MLHFMYSHEVNKPSLQLQMTLHEGAVKHAGVLGTLEDRYQGITPHFMTSEKYKNALRDKTKR